MSSSKGHPSTFRYLKLTRTSTSWFYVVWLLLALWMIASRILGQVSSFGAYFVLFLVPLAAGTGLLTSARAGAYDLLLGAGELRARIWRTAFFTASLVPAILATGVFFLGLHGPVIETLLRLISVLCFTAGVSFVVGLLEPRYLVGGIWLLSRIFLILLPGGLASVARLERGLDVPSLPVVALIVAAAPEALIGARLPWFAFLLVAVIGAAAIAASYRRFMRADFAGGRS